MLLYDSIAVHILVELFITKVIGSLKFDDRGVPEEVGDFHGCIKDALDDRGLLSLDISSEILSNIGLFLHYNNNYICLLINESLITKIILPES